MCKLFNNRFLKKILLSPGLESSSLDSKDHAIRVRKIITKEKPFLKKIYLNIYNEFKEIDIKTKYLGGESLEIGSGGGFLKEVIPNVITSDVVAHDYLDRVENAYSLTFEDNSLRTIFMIDVLHHLGCVEKFFVEVSRTLKPGGKLVMVEPYGSLWGKIFYKYFHYENYDDSIKNWEFIDKGPLSSSNVALPKIIFHRDRKKFEQLFPNLKIESIRYHTFILYLLSGGLTVRQLVPTCSFSLFNFLEKCLTPLMKSIFGTFQTIVIKKV